MELKKDITNLIKSLYKCHSNLIKEQKALVLFNIGVCCVAINNEADMLYIKMGWELIDFEDDNTIYSFMIINQYGIKVLESMKYNIVKYDSLSIIMIYFQQLPSYNNRWTICELIPQRRV